MYVCFLEDELYELEDFAGLESKLSKFIENQDLMHTAYINSYRIIKGDDIEKMLKADYHKGFITPFVFDPWTEPEISIMEKMILYFISIDYFEECGVLKKLIELRKLKD